jgi:hypothetical protein
MFANGGPGLGVGEGEGDVTGLGGRGEGGSGDGDGFAARACAATQQLIVKNSESKNNARLLNSETSSSYAVACASVQSFA